MDLLTPVALRNYTLSSNNSTVYKVAPWGLKRR
jgi:hypothetical protein